MFAVSCKYLKEVMDMRVRKALREANWIVIVLGIGGVLILGMLLFDLLTPPVFAGPPKYLQVDGKQYYVSDSAKGKNIKGVEMAGQITSTVLKVGVVDVDDQANFNCLGSQYAWIDGQLMLKYEGKWYPCIELKN